MPCSLKWEQQGKKERKNLHQTVLHFEIYFYNCLFCAMASEVGNVDFSVISNESIQTELCMTKERHFQNYKRYGQVCFSSNDPYTQ
jgi:hypothetical protein